MLGRRNSDAVVIQNLDDRDISCPCDGLRELIVIDQNELARRRLEQVALGKNANESVVGSQNRESKLGDHSHIDLGLAEGQLRVQAHKLGREHLSGCDGSPREKNSGCRIMRR